MIKRYAMLTALAVVTMGGASAAALTPTALPTPGFVPCDPEVHVCSPPTPETTEPPETLPPPPPPPTTEAPPPPTDAPPPPTEAPPPPPPPAEPTPTEPPAAGGLLCSGWILFHGTVDPAPSFFGSIHVFVVMIDLTAGPVDLTGDPPDGTLVFAEIPTTDDSYGLWVIAFHDISEPYSLIEHAEALALLNPDC